MKKILFLHPNFPAQFKVHAKLFADSGHDVRFLCQTHYNRKIKKVKLIVIKKRNPINEGGKTTSIITPTSQSETAINFRQGFLTLKNNGWNPDIVISHSGWGCGTYVKAIWPSCNFISYSEWWFNPCSSFYSYDQNNETLGINTTKILSHWERNRSIALELGVSDHIICPTEWQKDQLPNHFREKTMVIRDGINIEKYSNKSRKRHGKPTVTYGTRGMEPVRAFERFIKEIPKILELDLDICVEIAGFDEINYGGNKPKDFKSWGSWAKDFLKRNSCSNRVKWLGYMDEENYISWLHRSWCHIYLTHPYVLSWSFLEAFVAGCPIVASKVEPVIEFQDPRSCILIDHRVEGEVAKGVSKALSTRNFWLESRIRDVADLSLSRTCERLEVVTGVHLTTNA